MGKCLVIVFCYCLLVYPMFAMEGGYMYIDENEPEIQKAIEFAKNNLCPQTGTTLTFVRVWEAMKSVNMTPSYYIGIEVLNQNGERDSCRMIVAEKSPDDFTANVCNCAVDKNIDVRNTMAGIRAQLNLPRLQLNLETDSISRRYLKHVMEILNYSLQTDVYYVHIKSVLNAEAEYVGGSNYFFTLKLAQSNCTKDEDLNDFCAINLAKGTSICYVKYYAAGAEEANIINKYACSKFE